MRNYRRGFLLLIALVVLDFGLPAGSAGNDYRIVPGERIGDVTLAMSIDDTQFHASTRKRSTMRGISTG